MADHFATRFAAILEEWKGATTVELMAVSYALAPKDTGKFAASLYPRVFSRVDEHVWEIHSNDEEPKAIWVRDGTNPHRIPGSGFAHLSWGADKGMIFSSWVNHPGTDPNDWGDRVLDIVGPTQLEVLAEMIDVA